MDYLTDKSDSGQHSQFLRCFGVHELKNTFILPGGAGEDGLPPNSTSFQVEKAKLGIDTMVWDLLIQIFPTYPNHAAHASQLSSRLSAPA